MKIFKAKPNLKILFVASEAAPFSKAGGLGEVMFALPKALAALGYDARVMIPRYAGINQDKFFLKMLSEGLMVPTDAQENRQPRHLQCNIKQYENVYFLENREYYEQRANIYGYADDTVRWALLSRGVLEFLNQNREWMPDIIVSSDWQAAFLPNYLKTTYKDYARLSGIATVFSIHNLYYQGMFDHKFVSEMDYDAGQAQIPSFFDTRLLKLNMMRRGIMYADVINTVSPTYAKEIMTLDYGESLDGLLRERRSVVYGILNGIDYDTVNPKTDPHLPANYDVSSAKLRIQNKLELQKCFGLQEDSKKFVVGIVSRLDEQKGFDLLFDSLEALLHELDMQLVVVGSGDAKYMSFFGEIAKKFPERVAAHLSFDTVLPHLVFGGADAVLIPSKFEPSGLTQMEAMRYGAIPIARRTGGLADTVEDYGPGDEAGTGFVFERFSSQALSIALVRAYETYRHPSLWNNFQRRAMSKDFSWEHSAKEYIKLFEKAIDIKKGNVLG
ncbi:hypothetical protein A3G55_01200 [Candidatus Giovannonibacteria bacterium RIFCSPLOWO2_12_FULL_44_25]|uniref:Glycogen synthase n=2 Tax=Candidatus Giovannoniibacteriota TaxID=1752738 RepID=A0A1F5W8Y7_9BACT|nr:MAG: glycogen/starch synthase, ADP-glucose type, starch synthase [Parcubacteria group bacterium GW2011_GWC1_44_10]KKT59190.1 MAG: glycogen/starch synthase, ADP-glucose type [Candidatus Giovannonibacteria bacterium GW2011_GWA1_44_25]KKU29914.1 MAG: glycogen/starch synthase, ADP-glucose type [Candidatus Giovannonibacteria bacterium GW2011_GWB1_46_20]OGF60321.1 MAG: hypothetical protein A2W40_04120 [Candidatus Giovannonibacteria bacterium RIFCSPHIGHO2_01_45_12]OGF60942.1 MAG: hypothetical prote